MYRIFSALARISARATVCPGDGESFRVPELSCGGCSFDAVRAALNGGVIAAENDTEPSNQAAVESGDLLVKVEQGGGEGDVFRVLAAADNLRLAARNAVATALQLAALRPGARVQ